jgi:outer membrane protein
MKNFLRQSFLVFVVTGLLAVPARAQNKIAIIDLQKTFDFYYKTKQADAQLQERKADFKKTGDSMLEDYKRANEEYKKLLESANDQALAADERERRNKSASDKLLDIKKMEQELGAFDRQFQTLIGEQMRRARDNILREIKEVIVKKAKEASYTMVLDIAAKTINDTPVLLYTNGENDITDLILRQLNASAPPDLIKPEDSTAKPEKKDEKKDEKKENKK